MDKKLKTRKEIYNFHDWMKEPKNKAYLDKIPLEIIKVTLNSNGLNPHAVCLYGKSKECGCNTCIESRNKNRKSDVRPEIRKLDSNITNVVSREDGNLEIYVKKKKETTKQKVMRFISQRCLNYSFLKVDFHEVGSVN